MEIPRGSIIWYGDAPTYAHLVPCHRACSAQTTYGPWKTAATIRGGWGAAARSVSSRESRTATVAHRHQRRCAIRTALFRGRAKKLKRDGTDQIEVGPVVPPNGTRACRGSNDCRLCPSLCAWIRPRKPRQCRELRCCLPWLRGCVADFSCGKGQRSCAGCSSSLLCERDYLSFFVTTNAWLAPGPFRRANPTSAWWPESLLVRHGSHGRRSLFAGRVEPLLSG